MYHKILLAIIQAFTEFLPISSSGHLAIASRILGFPQDLFFYSVLHVASLFAVLIYFREEIFNLFTFKEIARKKWIFLIIATIPAAFFGFFFKGIIEEAFSSKIGLGMAFLFSGGLIFLTKLDYSKKRQNGGTSFLIGLFQILALFPGVSRSGTTTSSGIILGIEKEKAGTFSFLLFIPLAIGAILSETGNAYFNLEILVSFLVCFVLSYLSIGLFFRILKKGFWWAFSIYVWFLGLVVLLFF
jgi:undecaprenyl-diphosphatase